MGKKCCFLGEGVIFYKNIVYEKSLSIIENLIVKHNVSEFYGGYSSDLEKAFTEAVVEVKKKYPHIQLCLNAPYLLFASEEEKERQLKKYDRIEITCLVEKYKSDVVSGFINDLLKRADFLVCYVEMRNTFLLNEIEKIRMKKEIKVFNFADFL